VRSRAGCAKANNADVRAQERAMAVLGNVICAQRLNQMTRYQRTTQRCVQRCVELRSTDAIEAARAENERREKWANAS